MDKIIPVKAEYVKGAVSPEVVVCAKCPFCGHYNILGGKDGCCEHQDSVTDDYIIFVERR